MTSTESCIDCGTPLPGGGFCRRCLRNRIRELQAAWEGIEARMDTQPVQEAADADAR